MRPFEYVARTESGRTVRGRIVAETSAQAAESVRSRGLIPLSVGPQGGTPVSSTSLVRSEDTSPDSDADGPVEWAARGVDRALRPEDDGSWRLLMTRSDLLERLGGRPADFPDWVEPTAASLETHGALDAAMGEIEWALEADEETTRAIRAPFAFMRTVTTIAPVLVGFTVHVARGLSASADQVLRLYGPAVFACGLIHLALRYLWRTPSARATRVQMYLSLPYVGPWLRLYGLQRFAHILRALLDHGMPLSGAVVCAAPSVAIPRTIRRLRAAGERAEYPNSPHRLFAEAGELPPELVAQIAVLEEAGRLDDLGERLVEDLDRRAANAFIDMRFAVGMVCGAAGVLVLLAAGCVGAAVGHSDWLARIYLLNDE